ncbi:MAG: DUF3352 domain-containing protein [Thermoleophilaceae bacterium]|nr:DUF3352 domain-containing protein [Thermoleophilaceae bacterium]
MEKLSLTAIAALAIAALAAGCGKSSGGDAGADPAATLPVAPIYVSVDVGEGSERDNLGALINKVGGAGTTGKLRDSIQKSFDDAEGDTKVDFAKDIEPWLGEEAGAAITSVTDKDADFALAVASKDTGKTEDFINKVKGSGDGEKSYEGTDYIIDKDDDAAAGVVGDYLVVARNEPSFKKAVDAEKGESLADEPKFKEAQDESGDESVAFLYADPKGLLKVLQSVPGVAGPQAQALKQLPGLNSDQPVTASLEASETEAVFQTTAAATPEAKKQAESQPDLGSAPEDTFLALASGSAGGSIEEQLKTLPQQQRDLVDQQLKAQTGLTIDGLLGWIDSFQLTARGTSVTALGVGITLGSNDPAQSKKAVLALAKLAREQAKGQIEVKISGDEVTIGSPQLPGEVTIDSSGEEVKITYGDQGSGELSGSDAYESAVESLDGGKAAFFVDPAPITNLIAGVAGSSPQFAQAKPILEKFSYMVAGSKIDGDNAVGRFVIGVK